MSPWVRRVGPERIRFEAWENATPDDLMRALAFALCGEETIRRCAEHTPSFLVDLAWPPLPRDDSAW
jgi:hypothetical protein